MKKKLLFVMLVSALLITACGNKGNEDENLQDKKDEVNTESVVDTEVGTELESTEIISSESEEQSQNTESDAPASSENVTPPANESTAPVTPTYTYTELNKTMYAKSSVNVRDLPSTDGTKLGGLSKAQEVHITGQCNETGWYRIDYNGGLGYVSSSYLVDNKPQQETTSNSGSVSNGGVAFKAIDGETYSLRENESITVTDDDGSLYIYHNWNGYIIKHPTSRWPELAELDKKVAYSNNYDIVMSGNYAAMKLPKDVYFDTDACFKYEMQLVDYIESLGYYETYGWGQHLDINYTCYYIICEFEKWE